MNPWFFVWASGAVLALVRVAPVARLVFNETNSFRAPLAWFVLALCWPIPAALIIAAFLVETVRGRQ